MLLENLRQKDRQIIGSTISGMGAAMLYMSNSGDLMPHAKGMLSAIVKGASVAVIALGLSIACSK